MSPFCCSGMLPLSKDVRYELADSTEKTFPSTFVISKSPEDLDGEPKVCMLYVCYSSSLSKTVIKSEIVGKIIK